MDLSWSHGINNMRSFRSRYKMCKCFAVAFIFSNAISNNTICQKPVSFCHQFQWKRLVHVWTLPLLSFGFSCVVPRIIGIPLKRSAIKKKQRSGNQTLLAIVQNVIVFWLFWLESIKYFNMRPWHQPLSIHVAAVQNVPKSLVATEFNMNIICMIFIDLYWKLSVISAILFQPPTIKFVFAVFIETQNSHHFE